MLEVHDPGAGKVGCSGSPSPCLADGHLLSVSSHRAFLVSLSLLLLPLQIYLFFREHSQKRKHAYKHVGGEGEGERNSDSMLSMDPNSGLDLTAQRP